MRAKCRNNKTNTQNLFNSYFGKLEMERKVTSGRPRRVPIQTQIPTKRYTHTEYQHQHKSNESTQHTKYRTHRPQRLANHTPNSSMFSVHSFVPASFCSCSRVSHHSFRYRKLYEASERNECATPFAISNTVPTKPKAIASERTNESTNRPNEWTNSKLGSFSFYDCRAVLLFVVSVYFLFDRNAGCPPQFYYSHQLKLCVFVCDCNSQCESLLTSAPPQFT